MERVIIQADGSYAVVVDTRTDEERAAERKARTLAAKRHLRDVHGIVVGKSGEAFRVTK